MRLSECQGKPRDTCAAGHSREPFRGGATDTMLGGAIPPLHRDRRGLATSRDRGCGWMAWRYADRGSRPQLPRPDERMAGLVSRLGSRAGRAAEQLGGLGAAAMPLEQRLCRDGTKASSVHLAQRSAMGSETRRGTSPGWLRVRAADGGNGDFMWDRHSAWDAEL